MIIIYYNITAIFLQYYVLYGLDLLLLLILLLISIKRKLDFSIHLCICVCMWTKHIYSLIYEERYSLKF